MQYLLSYVGEKALKVWFCFRQKKNYIFLTLDPESMHNFSMFMDPLGHILYFIFVPPKVCYIFYTVGICNGLGWTEKVLVLKKL